MDKDLHSSSFESSSPRAERGVPPPEALPDPRPALPMELLGEPLSIREAAQLVGCSVWGVRQRLIPQGLPHFRSAPSGRLIFYRDQVIRWVLQKQKQGGMR